jgi:DNA-binding NarL/FixJ family response regulator
VVVVPALAVRVEEPRTEHVDTLLVDRQPLFLAALGSLLGANPLAARVMTSSRTDEALAIVRSGPVDLICCELHAVPISGIELVATLSKEERDIPVILLGDEGDETQLAAALASNVAGLFTKSSDPDEFLAGVSAVLSGHRAIGSGVIRQLLARVVSPYPQESRHNGSQLSPTELEILAMIGQAHSIPAIAASRGISHKTVRNHLAKIYRKLELHGRTEAMLWAARMGLTGS